MSPERDDADAGGQQPEMTRERARSERRDLDKERGEPVAGPRGARRSLKRLGRPLGDWTSRPRILVTNDDGIESRGILALKRALDPIGDVTVVAPDTNQSAVGHQKTLMRPLRVRERTLADGSLGYSVDGSPTDCVSLAFLGFFEERFDLVAIGINYGANLGDDITYSGTVSAAMEAVINNCPAFAVSQEYVEDVDFELAAVASAIVARNILEHGLKRGELRVGQRARRSRSRRARASRSPASAAGSTRTSSPSGSIPRGIPYYWIGGPPPSGISVPGTDFNAVVNRRVSVTPIHLDLTGRRLLRQLQTWNWSLDEAAHEAAHGADPGRRPRRDDAVPGGAGADRGGDLDRAALSRRPRHGRLSMRETHGRRVARQRPDRDPAPMDTTAIATRDTTVAARPGYDPTPARTVARVRPMLAEERVVWLSTVRPDGTPHLVPTWFLWDGEALVVFSKPGAAKVRNLRANPRLMVAVGDPEDDFSVGLIEAEATCHDERRADPGRVLRQVRDGARPGTPRRRRLPRDVHPGDPHRADALPPVARPRRGARPLPVADGAAAAAPRPSVGARVAAVVARLRARGRAAPRTTPAVRRRPPDARPARRCKLP